MQALTHSERPPPGFTTTIVGGAIDCRLWGHRLSTVAPPIVDCACVVAGGLGFICDMAIATPCVQRSKALCVRARNACRAKNACRFVVVPPAESPPLGNHRRCQRLAGAPQCRRNRPVASGCLGLVVLRPYRWPPQRPIRQSQRTRRQTLAWCTRFRPLDQLAAPGVAGGPSSQRT